MNTQGTALEDDTTESQLPLPFAEDMTPKSTLPLGEKLETPKDKAEEEKEDPRNPKLRKLLYSGLIYFEQQLEHQKHGMAMEGGSDSPAVYKGLTAHQPGDLVSTGCAVVLISLMERQRRALKRDLKHILEIWTDFQQNRTHDDKDVRRTAYDVLEHRIRESGIIFEKLPEHDPQDFHAGKFSQLAKQFKIYDDGTKPERKTLRDHWIKAGQFVGEFVEEFINAPANITRIPFIEAAKGSFNHFAKYKLLKPQAKNKHRIIKSDKIELDLSKVTVNSMSVLDNKDYDPELVRELVATRDSVRDYIKQDKEASILFITQTLFMVGQVGSLIDNALKGDGGNALINLACMNMASVALRVLSENKVHFTQALEGERSKMSEQYASVAGLLEKKKRKHSANDNMQDHTEHGHNAPDGPDLSP